MDQSLTLARHFARLVWLLLHEPGNIDEQKATLRALVATAKERALSLVLREGHEIAANGEPLATAFSGVRELAERMATHGLREVAISSNAAPADVLGAARILAGEAVLGDGGHGAHAKLQSLSPRTVRFTTLLPLTPTTLAALPTPIINPAVPAQPVAPPEPAPAQPSGGIDLGLPEIREIDLGLDLVPEAEEASAPTGVPPAPAVAPVAPDVGAPPPREGAPIVHDGGGLWMAFSAAQVPTEPTEQLLARLDETRSVNVVTKVLDDLVAVAENAAREGKSHAVADVFYEVVRREANVKDAELKRAYVMAVRRLSRPPLLRAVATMLPRKRDRAEDYFVVLVRTGEDGADALIEQLTQAQTASDRRVYYDVLIRLKAGVPALIHMLGDARWFVARNAADLLGEMRCTEAENALVELLTHRDDRVRRAATYALVAIGTPTALRAIHAAIRDDSPNVRMQAAMAIAAKGGERSAGTLTKALDDETDPDVQVALLAALGKVGTPDAVQKLVKAAEPEGRFFKRKTTPFRVAAIQALAEARTPAALAALTELQGDREREVREAAGRALQTAAKKQ